MNFDEIINNCIDIFSNATSKDLHCIKRYEHIVFLLNEMRTQVKAEVYPRDYPVLPLFHYVERHMDSDEMYNSIKILDRWYADTYRNKTK